MANGFLEAEEGQDGGETDSGQEAGQGSAPRGQTERTFPSLSNPILIVRPVLGGNWGGGIDVGAGKR